MSNNTDIENISHDVYLAKMFKKTMGEFLINLSDAFEEYDTELLDIRKGLKKVSSGDLLAEYKNKTKEYSELLSTRDESGLRNLGRPITIFNGSDFDFMKIWNSDEIDDSIRDTIWNYILHFQVYSNRKISQQKKSEISNDNIFTNKDIMEGNVKIIEKAMINPETGNTNEFGQILNELTEQFSQQFQNNPEEILSGTGMMNLMQNIASTLQHKQESGEIDMEKMAVQAQSMLGNLKLGGIEKTLFNQGDETTSLNILTNLLGNLGNISDGNGKEQGGINSLGNVLAVVNGLMGDKNEDEIIETYKAYKSEVPVEFLDKLRVDRENKKKKSIGNNNNFKKKSEGRKKK